MNITQPGNELAAALAAKIFDRIEYDGTLIRSSIEEVIRDGVLLDAAKRFSSNGSGDLDEDLRQAAIHLVRGVSRDFSMRLSLPHDLLVLISELQRLLQKMGRL